MAESVLCVGLDIAWFGGSANRSDSQYDCLGWAHLLRKTNKSMRVVECGLERIRLHDRDLNATILLKSIASLLSKHSAAQKIVFAIDAPIQAVKRSHLPPRSALPKKGEVERRACEDYFSSIRQAIDRKSGGSKGWQPNIQPGAPLAPRVQYLLNSLRELGFAVWTQENCQTEKLLIECFPAEAIWAMKRLGLYSEEMTAKQVKAYKKQDRQSLNSEKVKELILSVLDGFEAIPGLSGVWNELVEYSLGWMLKDNIWQTANGQYRGGKMLDDVVDTMICLTTSLSYVCDQYHVWQCLKYPEDGHIVGPGKLPGKENKSIYYSFAALQ